MAWNKLATKTLTGASDTIQPDAVFTSKTFNQILIHKLNSGAIDPTLRLGKTTIDTGTNYARGYSGNGGADVTNASQTSIGLDFTSGAWTMFTVLYVINISAQEKLAISFNVEQNTAGAGTAPVRMEVVGKWANTANQFDLVNTVNVGAGDYDTSSNITILGTD